jgi:hypothetical protein
VEDDISAYEYSKIRVRKCSALSQTGEGCMEPIFLLRLEDGVTIDQSADQKVNGIVNLPERSDHLSAEYSIIQTETEMFIC